MKYIYTLLFAVTIITAHTQVISFPDANFKQALIEEGVDTNGDGDITQTEALAVTELEIRNASILDVSGLEYFTNLKELNCGSNPIEVLDISNLIDLERLSCDRLEIEELDVENFQNLNYLDCTSSMIKNLRLVNLPSLVEYYGQFNFMEVLIVENLPSLEILQCSANFIEDLVVHDLPNLKFLNVADNELFQLSIENLPSLETLDCWTNNLTGLTVKNLPLLKDLDTRFNPFQSIKIEDLPSLSFFTCNQTGLLNLELNDLPSLQTLECDFSDLTTLQLSNLPVLTTVDASSNDLTQVEFADLPLLRVLNLSFNELEFVTVENLPSLDLFFVYNNNLEILNLKNGRELASANFNENPDLKFVCANEWEYQRYLIQAEEAGYANVVVNSYCSFAPGGDFYRLEGVSYFEDINGNCLDKTNPLEYIKYAVGADTLIGYATANDTGMYSAPLLEGDYWITAELKNMESFEVEPDSVFVSFPMDNTPFVQDFCIRPKFDLTDIEISMFPVDVARPGFDANYKLILKNHGTVSMEGRVDLYFPNNRIDFVSAQPEITDSVDNKLVWEYAELGPLETQEFRVVFNVNSPMETPPVLGGDILGFTANAFPLDLDLERADNVAIFNQEVVNAFDPNDKTCLEGSTITEEMVGEFLHYQIRFENTGTAEAINVVVRDSIDETRLDISTLEIIDATHDVRSRIRGNVVEFIFENILLPFEDATNDGHVVFKVKSLASLVLGDVVENNADIFFDFNFPIRTNTTTTQIEVLSNVENQEELFDLDIFPVPTKGIVQVSSKEKISTIHLYNLQGLLLKTGLYSNSSMNYTLDLSNLQQGKYIIQMISENGDSVTRKILKL